MGGRAARGWISSRTAVFWAWWPSDSRRFWIASDLVAVPGTSADRDGRPVRGLWRILGCSSSARVGFPLLPRSPFSPWVGEPAVVQTGVHLAAVDDGGFPFGGHRADPALSLGPPLLEVGPRSVSFVKDGVRVRLPRSRPGARAPAFAASAPTLWRGVWGSDDVRQASVLAGMCLLQPGQSSDRTYVQAPRTKTHPRTWVTSGGAGWSVEVVTRRWRGTERQESPDLRSRPLPPASVKPGRRAGDRHGSGLWANGHRRRWTQPRSNLGDLGRSVAARAFLLPPRLGERGRAVSVTGGAGSSPWATMVRWDSWSWGGPSHVLCRRRRPSHGHYSFRAGHRPWGTWSGEIGSVPGGRPPTTCRAVLRRGRRGWRRGQVRPDRESGPGRPRSRTQRDRPRPFRGAQARPRTKGRDGILPVAAPSSRAGR